MEYFEYLHEESCFNVKANEIDLDFKSNLTPF